MKKVIIYAYTKFNLGDDLFIKILCERYDKTRFILYAPKEYKETFKDLKNLTCYSSQNYIFRAINILGRIIKCDNLVQHLLAKRCNGAVYIGGSLFIQGENWREYFSYIKSLKKEGQPFYLLGANFGPYKDEEYLRKHKELFLEYRDICFREKFSYDLFKDLPNRRVAKDIVFSLKHRKLEEENMVTISVIKPSNRKELKEWDGAYYEKIKDISITFINRGINVNLMSFCAQEGDKEAIKEIVNILPQEYKEKVKRFYYKTNIEEALNIIGKSKYIVASRFHGVILALVFNKKVLPLIYSEKTTNVLEDIKYEGIYYHIKNLSNISVDYSWIYNKKRNIKNEELNGYGHFEKLDEFLMEDSE